MAWCEPCPADAPAGTIAAMATLLIRSDRVFDGIRMRTAAVLVRDGMIVDVGPDIAAPDATIVDAPGRTLLPGLIDAHTQSSPAALSRRWRSA